MCNTEPFTGMNKRLTTTFLLLCLGLLFQRGSAFTTQCRENEEYSECGSGCPLTCKNHQESLFCTEHCKKGCFCKPGYVLGPDNKCILPDHCPIGPCRNTEVASTCVNPCNNCLQRGVCHYRFCNKGCDCKPGYHRNSTGICVIASKCESQESACPKNEHYVNCVSQCNDCWSRGDCEEEEEYCNAGCDCKPGYFRDDYGTCVSEQQCMSQGMNCGVNEVSSECVVPCNDCEKRGNCQYTCEYGCDCKKGYHRNSKGVCVHSSQCFTTACGIYEEYNECGSACPHTCSNLGKSIVCTQQCVKGCFCINAYVRGPDRKCIKPNDCPSVCGDYEVFQECGSQCEASCTNLTTSSNSCSLPCKRRCFCSTGYVRGPDGKCILPASCPTVCGDYEIFQECGSQCEASCTNLTTSSISCSLPCKRGCFCSPGYVRGQDGKCILPASCPTVCGDYEILQECGSQCEASCTNLTTSSNYCSLPCKRGCFCSPGYVRGPDGKCILLASCPTKCKENEIYMRCGPRCEPSCSFLHRSAALCPSCKKGCFCKPGYVRGPTDNCILPTSCPPVCGENEEYSECGSACPVSCLNRSPNCTNRCVKGCFCKAGYIKDVDGNCIRPTDCPAQCKKYEEFNECGPACPATCFNRSQVCIQICVRGCFCIPGYVKSPQGDCILPSQCPVVCGENEEFTECGSACPHTCDNRNSVCPPACVRGCFCKNGYIKDSNGKCILPINCPIDCPENEYFRLCGTSCPMNCTNIGKSISCKLECVRGCFCNDGFVRGPEGKCIKPDSCPKQKNCGRNEVYKSCSRPCQHTCKNHTKPITETSCPGPCISGCFCKPSYVRDQRRRCIPKRSCTKGDPRRCNRRRCPGGIGGRNRGTGTEVDKVETTLSTSDGTKIPLTTGSSLDSTTKPSEVTTAPDLTSLDKNDFETTAGEKITANNKQSTMPEIGDGETSSNPTRKATQLIETTNPPIEMTEGPTIATTVKSKDPPTTVAVEPRKINLNDPLTPIARIPTTIKPKDSLPSIALMTTTIKDNSPTITEDAVVDGKTTPAESANSTILTKVDNSTAENVIATTTPTIKIL